MKSTFKSKLFTTAIIILKTNMNPYTGQIMNIKNAERLGKEVTYISGR